MKRKTTEEFIRQATEIHNNKYDYSLVDYKNAFTKVRIICPKHGEFEQPPHDHLKGHGCPKCGFEATAASNFYTTEEFIQKVKKIHGDKYDYSLVDYKATNIKVKIICPKHGEFLMTPTNLFQGYGCQKCGVEYVASVRKLTTEKFIQKARKIHGDKYDYSLVDYKNAFTKVKIICSKHGKFEQKPYVHISNHGCPKCQESKGEKKISDWLLNNGFKEGVDFERQKSFPDCKDKLLLRFDFYFKPKDILIEYQGIQHYQEVESFSDFTNTKLHDKIKKDYAEKFHNFLEISYKDFSRIEKILAENLLRS